MKSALEAYLVRLELELKRRGLFDARIVEEARGHLTDSADQEIQRGLSSDAAEREAISRFGSPESIAGNFARERFRLVAWFRFAGACAGTAIRRVLATGVPIDHNRLEFHDKPSPRFHFAVKSKRGWVNPEFLAIASDPATELVPFLERVAPAPFGPLGPVQSVTLVEAESTKDAKKYRVVFGQDVKTICAISLAPNGQGMAIDWSREVPPG